MTNERTSSIHVWKIDLREQFQGGEEEQVKY